MRINFTHVFDLAHRVVIMVGAFILIAIGFDLLSPVGNFLADYLPSWLVIILIFIYFIGGLGSSVFLLEKTICPYWIATYLYARLFLSVTLERGEAERVGFLFDGSLGGSWHPLKAIGMIDKKYRKEALFRFANVIANEKNWTHPFPMPEDKLNTQQAKQQTGNKFDQAHASPVKPSLDTQIQVALEMLGLEGRPDNFASIKEAYRRKISEFHPDKFYGEKPEVTGYAEETSKKLNIAYKFLEENYRGLNEAG